MANEAVGPSGSKRQRTSPLCLTDLPDGALDLASHFLPKPSVALLAVALTGPSRSWAKFGERRPPLSPPSRALISSHQWDVLDFEDVDKALANKLSDDDLHAVLLCIDAKRTLERLFLAGCVKVDGSGLHPLRHSNTIEQIDLSLLRCHERPQLDEDEGDLPIQRIAIWKTIPILESILATEGCALRHLHLPRKWKSDDPYDLQYEVQFEGFLSRYTQHLDDYKFDCVRCRNEDCPKANDEYSEPWISTIGASFGLQQYTCYLCLGNQCNDNVVDLNAFLLQDPNHGFCWACMKQFCADCMEMKVCAGNDCGDLYCEGCYTLCKVCGDAYCAECEETCDCCNKVRCYDTCGAFYRCNNDSCEKINCSECMDENSVRPCQVCSAEYCFDCRFAEYQRSRDMQESFCSGCAKEVLPALQKKIDWMQQMADDIESLAQTEGEDGD